ncbi:MAG TPA: Hpt domain-containing protein, partial [Fibrobacteria bacterium]|nr:Hpt domain-containing protein [Fibrobacteria bacterium]
NAETLARLAFLDSPGRKDFQREIIQTYIRDTAKRLAELRARLAAGEHVEVGKLAHTMKGSSLNVGADGFAELMWDFERLGKAGTPSGADKIAAAEALFERVKAALLAYLGEG